MIVSKTPFRVSFFGGGTDYPSWFEKNNGSVLSTTIDKYLYISARYLPPFFDHKHRIIWSKVELVNKVSDIHHPLIREGLKMMNFNKKLGFDLHYQSDLPARSGMGSSSAFAVGLLKALYELNKKKVTKKIISRKAIYLERNILGEFVGSQDQVAAAYGGLNRINFKKNNTFEVKQINVKQNRRNELEDKLMLFYTGHSRYSSNVAESIVKRMNKNNLLLKEMQFIVDEAQKVLLSKCNLNDFGKLLHESWSLKRKLSTLVSSNLIDQVYETAINNGALGGKILGAGNAGFILIFAEKNYQKKIKKSLKKLLYLPFRLSKHGSKIIYNDGKDDLFLNKK